MQAVPAGNVLAIAGLDQYIAKSATVSSTLWCPPLAPMTFQSAAIVQVAVEPVIPSQMSKLEAGLARLEKADPFVEVKVLDSGEHVLGAAGEVHLTTCLKQLRERFAMIDLEVSMLGSLSKLGSSKFQIVLLSEKFFSLEAQVAAIYPNTWPNQTN